MRVAQTQATGPRLGVERKHCPPGDWEAAPPAYRATRLRLQSPRGKEGDGSRQPAGLPDWKRPTATALCRRCLPGLLTAVCKETETQLLDRRRQSVSAGPSSLERCPGSQADNTREARAPGLAARTSVPCHHHTSRLHETGKKPGSVTSLEKTLTPDRGLCSQNTRRLPTSKDKQSPENADKTRHTLHRKRHVAGQPHAEGAQLRGQRQRPSARLPSPLAPQPGLRQALLPLPPALGLLPSCISGSLTAATERTLSGANWNRRRFRLVREGTDARLTLQSKPPP